MGNYCQNCFQSNSFRQEQIICNTYLQAYDNQYFDVEIPYDDVFFTSYLSHQYWVQNRKQLKKNMKINRYYYGDWKNGMPEGRGIIYEPNIILINSQFVAGVPNNKSNVVFINKNSQYFGMLINGKMNGDGVMKDYLQMYTFSGKWQNSQPISGILTLIKDSNIEKIEILNFKKRIAKIFYKDGRIYQGEIDKNKMMPSGKGKVTFPTFDLKNYYEGDWRNGIYEGYGRFLWKNGQFYQGFYREGLKSGHGKFKFLDGNQYQGEWLKGKQHGSGVMFDINGFKIKQGEWQQGTYKGLSRFHHYDQRSQMVKYKSINTQNIQGIKQDYINQDNDGKNFFNQINNYKGGVHRARSLRMQNFYNQDNGIN